MTDRVIHNVRAMRPGVGVIGDTVTVRNGRIAAVETRGHDRAEAAGGTTDGDVTCDEAPEAGVFDGGGRLLTPGLIDVHTHGLEHWAYETDAEAMRRGLQRQPAYGVTSVLPTLIGLRDRARLDHLADLAAAMDAVDRVHTPGLHLEGPFLALPGAGCDTVPGDPAWLADLLNATGDRVSAMSISPDTPNILPVVRRLRERGIEAFITHTAGTVEQARAVIDAGARHATHFYDVFPAPAERDPGVRPCGVVEAVLADPRVSVDFITDGVHVDPAAIELALQCKGPAGVLAITDSNIGAGLGDGEYPTPWGMTVRVRQGDACRTHAPGEADDGTLSGSALTMNQAVANLIDWLGRTGRPAHSAWAMASRSVADRMGLTGKGELAPGADADLVLWDERDNQLAADRTWLGGRLVYEREPQADLKERVHG